jgi:hypothetical protein
VFTPIRDDDQRQRRGSMQSVRESAKGIDDIFTEVATLPSSTAPQSVVAWWPELSDGTIVPDDFISLAASGYEDRILGQPKEPRSASEESDPQGPCSTLQSVSMRGTFNLS